MRRFPCAAAVTLALLLATVPASRAGETLDQERLEMDWFGAKLEFRQIDDVDYLWVKPGFELDGKSLHFEPWPEPLFLGKHDRGDEDAELAKKMYEDMAATFARSFAESYGDRLQTSESEGDVLVSGRIVDCNIGSTAAKIMVGFGAGSGSTTIDMKFTDAESGELLAALHNQVVSGTTWSTTDSKFAKWSKEVAKLFAKKGLGKLYAKGDKVKE